MLKSTLCGVCVCVCASPVNPQEVINALSLSLSVFPFLGALKGMMAFYVHYLHYSSFSAEPAAALCGLPRVTQ